MIHTELMPSILLRTGFGEFSVANNTTYDSRHVSLLLDETADLQRMNQFLAYMCSIYQGGMINIYALLKRELFQ